MSTSSTPYLPTQSPSDASYRGVRGWLLALCVMFTLVGPAIAAWLMSYEYDRLAPAFDSSMGEGLAVIATLVLELCAVIFGAYAGVRLWRVQPRAVTTAKRALMFGLGVDIVATAIEATVAPIPSSQLIVQVGIGVVPSLIFFALCFEYLNRSRRVFNTYGDELPT